MEFVKDKYFPDNGHLCIRQGNYELHLNFVIKDNKLFSKITDNHLYEFNLTRLKNFVSDMKNNNNNAIMIVHYAAWNENDELDFEYNLQFEYYIDDEWNRNSINNECINKLLITNSFCNTSISIYFEMDETVVKTFEDMYEYLESMIHV